MFGEKPLACPKCGKAPVFQTDWHKEPGRRALYVQWYECSRFFGLVVHLSGSKNYIEKGWGDLGKEAAVSRWNAAVRGA